MKGNSKKAMTPKRPCTSAPPTHPGWLTAMLVLFLVVMPITLGIGGESARLPGEPEAGSRYETRQQVMVICQRWLGPYKLLRRVSVPGRGCFDEYIDTYRGQLEGTRPAPCSQNC